MASLQQGLLFASNKLVRIQAFRRRCIHSSAWRLLQREEDMDHLEKNPFYAKYANKIASTQK